MTILCLTDTYPCKDTPTSGTFVHFLNQQLMFDIRSKIFRHIQSLSLSFFDKNPVGRLMTRVTSDVEALNQMFTQGIVSIFGDIFLLAGIIGALLYLDARLAVWILSIIDCVQFNL